MTANLENARKKPERLRNPDLATALQRQCTPRATDLQRGLFARRENTKMVKRVARLRQTFWRDTWSCRSVPFRIVFLFWFPFGGIYQTCRFLSKLHCVLLN